MHYTVDPGLYALGGPDANAPVLVTANYKMSFDHLRSALKGHDAWILVLETLGINVWCAAGKGTFGNSELVGRMQNSRLAERVNHRQLILPQLGAPGIAAYALKKETGFSAVYGPVNAGDLPAFLAGGMKATPAMRRKDFPLGERMALVPMEFVPAMKWAMLILPIVFLLGGLGDIDHFRASTMQYGVKAAAVIFSGLIAGTVFTPMLLPWLPGRAFTVKGAAAGAVTSSIVLWAWPMAGGAAVTAGEAVGLLLMASAFSAFLGMNFTGSTTYTSLSGVRKEMKWAVPAEILAAVFGVTIWLGVLVL